MSALIDLRCGRDLVHARGASQRRLAPQRVPARTLTRNPATGEIEMYRTLAFEHAFRLGENRVSVEVVEQVLSRAIDELEPPLTATATTRPH